MIKRRSGLKLKLRGTIKKKVEIIVHSTKKLLGIDYHIVYNGNTLHLVEMIVILPISL